MERIAQRFRDRREAAALLAERLRRYAGRDDVVVLGLPRGGVPVAFEIARGLGAPLDVFLVRKLGVPGHEELALGAIATGGVRVVNRRVVEHLGLTPEVIDAIAAREWRELERRQRAYRDDRPPPDLTGRTVILVDDGLATGSTMWAAVQAVREERPARVVVAVPVAAPDTCAAFGEVADEVVCLLTPEPFGSVGAWYEDFAQTSDEEVRELLAQAAAPAAGDPEQAAPARREVTVEAGAARLAGDLVLPAAARGLVVFAHGSGSSRFSPRNRAVADVLNEAGLATLLMDLLTADEERADVRTRRLRFDIGLLGERVVGAVDRLAREPSLAGLPVGTFGASTGAAAALIAAAERPERVRAVVSRGGRPDLAGEALRRVHAPTLLIVGGNDREVIGLNHLAMEAIPGDCVLELVPGAGHLFEEPGALRRVAELARDWFLKHL
jgi:putative phosphoribosyl transferase